jgi:hypothetical protein
MLLQEVDHYDHILVSWTKMDMQVISLIDCVSQERENHCHFVQGKFAHPPGAQELLFRRMQVLGTRKV